ncbi:MAG: phosphoribosyl-AMP cyclohydrolase [Pirellula sp.]|jgi:phosphoribosyl-AMP cyclohydrolase
MPHSITQPDFSLGANGLLPAIAQDVSSGKVLMLAWMNQEAYLETVSSGFATYFSRSRHKLWRKGEESGHRQRVIEIRIDCDADTILVVVEQTGAACHEGYESCFFRVLRSDNYTVDQPLMVDPHSVYKTGSSSHRPKSSG